MPNSSSTKAKARARVSLAKSLAPEEVRVGDYVAPLHEAHEYPSFFWCDDGALVDRQEPVRIQYVAHGSGEPLKVESVCLPFVLVKHPARGTFPLDLRRCRLARLDRRYAARAWRSLKRHMKQRNRKRRKKLR